MDVTITIPISGWLLLLAVRYSSPTISPNIVLVPTLSRILSRGCPLITGENTYRQLIPVKECSEVIRLALALHPAPLTPDRLTLLDTLETHFEAVTDTPQPALAAEIFMHTCLSLIEQEQTQALLTGSTPPTEPPASYTSALTAIIKGFTA